VTSLFGPTCTLIRYINIVLLQRGLKIHRSATTKMSAFGQHGLAFHFQVYVILQLVMLLNIAVFLVLAERQKTGEFVAMKAQNGSVLCATSTPNSKTRVRSKLDCYRSCVESMGCLCASGANYRMKEKLCEMYSILPVDYQVDPDCKFYQVRLIWVWTCSDNNTHVY